MTNWAEQKSPGMADALERLRQYLKQSVIENPEYLKKIAMEYCSNEEEIADSFIKQVHENSIDSGQKLRLYKKYNAQNAGCSKENPIVISETRGFYTRLEYCIVKLLFMYRDDIMSYAVRKQSLSSNGDRRIDCLTIRTTTDCFMLDEEIIADPMPKHTHEEKYYFDITAGITSRNH